MPRQESKSGWKKPLWGSREVQMTNNCIFTIMPYKHHGGWVFDDEKAGLVQEAFVSGIPEIIEWLIAEHGIKGATKGFRLYFSKNPFPGSQLKLKWLRGDDTGNWYEVDMGDGVKEEGWLCPALFKYFDAAPKSIFVRGETIS